MQVELVRVGVSRPGGGCDMSWRQAWQPVLGSSTRTSSGPHAAPPRGLWGSSQEKEGCAHPGCVTMTLVSMVPGTQPSLRSGGVTESDRTPLPVPLSPSAPVRSLSP